MEGAAGKEDSPQMMELLRQCQEEEDEVREWEAPVPLSARLGSLVRRRRRIFAWAGASTLGVMVLVAVLLYRHPFGGFNAAVGQATIADEDSDHDHHDHHAEVHHGDHDHHDHDEEGHRHAEGHHNKSHHEKNKTAAKLAWVYRNAVKGEPWPSLFCWSHIEEWGSERDLVISQLKAKFGIFACNDFAVISRSKDPITLGPHPTNESMIVKTWSNSLPPDRKGNTAAGDTTSSYVNARTFLVAWKTLMKSGVFWSHDWIAKCDPDAVFYPERLRWHVAKYSKPPAGPGPFFLINCNLMGGRIYGALEVYSVLAIKEMDKRGFECEAMPLDKWGEDLYMEQCMTHLNGRQNGISDFQLVGDDRCTQAPCGPGYRAAFHPFPNIGAYWGCAAAAKR